MCETPLLTGTVDQLRGAHTFTPWVNLNVAVSMRHAADSTEISAAVATLVGWAFWGMYNFSVG